MCAGDGALYCHCINDIDFFLQISVASLYCLYSLIPMSLSFKYETFVKRFWFILNARYYHAKLLLHFDSVSGSGTAQCDL